MTVENPDSFDAKQVAAAANAIAANALAKAAESGDKVVIAQAFKETGASCKACHDKYRKD